eukprot:TRINITY_DN2688_c0_g1_i5.p1 TRINITY_DN2688_c0_g1~~TRINITY_DN2688_c0_g1_i5.p1  ORF type:complete len:187 (-),score=38.85 TRINITY_DN2688_c0_g1_i5:117-677(-)
MAQYHIGLVFDSSVFMAVVKRLESKGHKVNLLDPVVYTSLKTFQNRFNWMKEQPEELKAVQKILESSEGFVAVSPEYNYSFSAAIKTIIDIYLDEWKHKPFGLVSYSMGYYGGVRAVQELRQLTSNVGGVPIPSYVTVPAVHEALDEEGNFKQADSVASKSVDALSKELEWYATALSNQRKVDPLK